MRGEQRQHIAISNRALSILEADILALTPGLALSGFINEIATLFKNDALSSVSHSREKQAEKYRDAIKLSRYKEKRPRDTAFAHYKPEAVLLTTEDEVLIGQLADGKLIEAVQDYVSRPKDKTLKIRLRNELYDYLYGEEDWPEKQSYKSQGDYIRALLEEYCDLPFYEREAIVYKKQLDKLTAEEELPYDQRRVLTIRYMAKNGKTVKFDLKLFGIRPDATTSYHYVVGLSKRSNDPDDQYKVSSFRLSRLAEEITIRPKSYGTGKLTKQQQRSIKEALSTRGVQYLLTETQTFYVLLTSAGHAMYESILHGRPAYQSSEKVDSDHIRLTFDCTDRQITNYFFKFGAEALIENNEAIAADFRSKYLDAARAYEPLVSSH